MLVCPVIATYMHTLGHYLFINFIHVDLQLMCNWEKSGGLKFKFVLTLSNFINNESNNLELEYV